MSRKLPALARLHTSVRLAAARACPAPIVGSLAAGVRAEIRRLRHEEDGGDGMSTVAVVAHARKSLGGGLPELARCWRREGFAESALVRGDKSRKAPQYARRCAGSEGAELIFVWGGDGMVQRCVDAVAGTEAVLAILPAGTRTCWRRTCTSPMT